MALTYDQISAITQKKWVPKLVDNIFDSDILLKRAKSRGWYEAKNGGTSIMQPLMYAQITAAGSYAPQAQLDTTDNDTFTSAEYQWKYYYANITISGPDEKKNSGDAAILDFVKNKTMAAEKTLMDLIGDGIYSAGTTSTDIGGLRLVVDNANTVGGIDQSTYTWFQAQEDSTTTTFGISALQTQFNTLTINSESPTIAVATRANYNRYYGFLQPSQRFIDTESAKGGFQSLMFNGIPFVVGSKCPASHIFLLNESYLHLYYHPERNFNMQNFIPSSVHDAKTAKIFWMGNLGISNPRKCGKFTAVAA